MYGPLLMLVIFTPLLLIALFFAIAPYHIHERYEKKRNYTDKHGNHYCFYGSDGDFKRLSEVNPAIITKLQKNDKKRRFWNKLWDWAFIFTIIAIVLGFLILIFGVVGLCNTIEARDEVAVWEEFTTIAQETFDSANELEKIGIAGDVAEYNKWLAEARASKKLYGNWSSYYFCDIDGLRPITLD